MKEIGQRTGECHCGAVKFKTQLARGLETARRCSCSMCRMRGAVAVSAFVSDFEIVEGEDALNLYTFGTHSAKHYFCSRCGVYTHHRRRSNPDQYGINVACLEGLSPFDFEEVVVMDGHTHPKDRPGGKARQFGTLKFRSEFRELEKDVTR